MARATITEAWLDRSHKPDLYWCRRTVNLGVRVSSNGRKAFVFQKGQGKRTPLGSWPGTTLDQAAQKVVSLRKDSSEMRNVTLGQAFGWWAQRVRLNGGSEATITVREKQLRKWVSHLWDRKLDTISHTELAQLQLHIGESSAYAANDVLRHLGVVHRVGSPQAWAGAGIRPLRTGPATRKTMGDPKEWYATVQRAESEVVRAFWVFTLFTGLRKNDVLTARHSNLNGGWLHVPEPKGGATRAFDLPLSSWALEAIHGLPRDDDWVFPGQKPHCHLTTPKVPAVRSLCGTHALRHWWRYMAENVAGAPYPVVQKLLNHSSGRGITDHYGTRDIPPDLLADWAQKIGDEIAIEIGLQTEK